MFVRTQTNGDRTYLIVVENQRIQGKIQQRVLHRLGRLDELLAASTRLKESRERELEALIAPETRQALGEAAVELVDYRQL